MFIVYTDADEESGTEIDLTVEEDGDRRHWHV